MLAVWSQGAFLGTSVRGQTHAHKRVWPLPVAGPEVFYSTTTRVAAAAAAAASWIVVRTWCEHARYIKARASASFRVARATTMLLRVAFSQHVVSALLRPSFSLATMIATAISPARRRPTLQHRDALTHGSWRTETE